jgi:zinc protease
LGTFRVSAEVRTGVTGVSLHEFFLELDRIRDEVVSDEELANAKSYLAGVFPIRIETQDGLIDQLVSIKMFDLPEDYLHTYRDRINAVTAAEIQRVAQSHVTPDRAAIVVVGDAAEIRAQVQPYAKVIELYDTEGNQKTVGSKE